MTRWYGPRKIREMVPSKGAKRFLKHAPHSPCDIESRERKDRIADVVRMSVTLKEKSWKLTFFVDAVSPHGWKYHGEGGTPDEAFLKCFRLLRPV